jgi:hypothetical protein
MKLSVFSTVFAVAYAVIYLIAVEKNYALFTYHPALAEFGWGVQSPKDGPAMYWFGWLATAGIAAFALAMIASLIPQRAAERLSPGWAWTVPLAVLAAFAWLLRGYFLR